VWVSIVHFQVGVHESNPLRLRSGDNVQAPCGRDDFDLPLLRSRTATHNLTMKLSKGVVTIPLTK
jgi:hypothetical protein